MVTFWCLTTATPRSMTVMVLLTPSAASWEWAATFSRALSISSSFWALSWASSACLVAPTAISLMAAATSSADLAVSSEAILISRADWVRVSDPFLILPINPFSSWIMVLKLAARMPTSSRALTATCWVRSPWVIFCAAAVKALMGFTI